MKGYTTLTLLSLLLIGAALPGAAAGEEGENFVVVKAGHVITVTGDEIEKGTIVIRNGVIDAVGKNVEIPFPAKIIDAGDLWVMPGLISPFSLAGNRVFRRSGVHADLRIADEFDPDEDVLNKIARCGFTVLGFGPMGSGIPGQGMAARTVDGEGTARVLNDSAFVFIEMDKPSSDKKTLKGALDKAKSEIDKQEKAKKEWDEKQKKAAEEAAKKKEAEKKKEGEKKEPEKKKEGEKDAKKEEKKPEKFTPPPISPPYLPIADLIRKKEGV